MRKHLPATLAAATLLFSQGDSQEQARREFLKIVVPFNNINLRRMRGIEPSPEDAKIVQAFNARRGAIMQEFKKTQESHDSVGTIPLIDLGAGTYKGEQGGLYPGGKNTMPTAHLKAGLDLARKIVPLDAEGKPSPGGRIGFIGVGHSSWTMEFSVFVKHSMADPERNPKVEVIDCAQSAQSTEMSADPKAEYWNIVDQRLKRAGITPAQVQVVAFLATLQFPTLPFPKEPRLLQEYTTQTVNNLQAKFPNLKIAYLVTRIYGGYADIPLNPEPHAYETGFGVKWTIADQIQGKPQLNFDAAKGPVRAPWIAWGPYTWADGLKPRSDGLVWHKDEMRANDHTHPSEKGCEKVAGILLDFVKKDQTARIWYLK